MKNREILFIIKLRNQARKQFRGLTTDLNNLSRKAHQASKGIDRVSKASDAAGRKAATSGKAFTNLGGKLQRVRQFAVLAAAALAAIGIGVGIGKLFQDFVVFDKGLIGVAKTTGIAGEDLKKLGDEIQRISRVVPESQEKLLAIAQAAGQLGITGTANIVKFTETVGKLGLASNLSGEEAATALARILTISGEPIENVDRLAAAIVDLGNSFAANERQIASASLRVARATAQFPVSAAQVAGIATALVAVGVQAEEGGTVIQRAFLGIDAAIRKGGEEMQVLQDITGLTSKALKEGFKIDPTATFKALIDGLGRINDEGGSVAGALEALGLEGVRVIGTLGTLAARSDVLSATLKRSATAFRENTALNIEAAAAAKSFDAQMGLTSNTLGEVGIILGTEVAPFLLETAESLRKFLQEAKDSGDLATFFERVGNAVSFLADAFVLLAKVAAAFVATKILGFLITMAPKALLAAKGMNVLTGATLRASKAMKILLRAAVIGLIIEGVTLAIDVFGKLNEEVADGVDTWDIFGATAVGVFVAIGDTISDVFGGLGKFIDAIGQAGGGNFAAALDSIRDGLAQLGDVDIDIAGAVDDQFRILAQAAAKRGMEFAANLDEGLTNEIIRNIPNAKENGKKLGKAVSEGFLAGLEGFTGGREAFNKELEAIVGTFRPAIAAAKEQARQLEVLNLALLAGESRLKKFGLTQAEVKKLIEEVTAAQKVALTVFQKELKTINQRIELIGRSNSQKIVEKGLQDAKNKALEAGNKLSTEELAILRARLELEASATLDAEIAKKKVDAQKALNSSIDDTITSLQTQIELSGLTGDALQRETILIAFRNQATKAGIELDTQKIAKLKEQIEINQQAKRVLEGNPFEGIKAGFTDFIETARDLNTQFKDFTSESIGNLKDTFTDFIETGKLDFSDFLSSILSGLQQIATNKIFQELGGALFGAAAGGTGGGFLETATSFLGDLFSSGGGGGTGSIATFAGLNKGGVVGKDGAPTLAHSSIFKNAQKFAHGGTVVGKRGTDTVPILATPGEVVLSKDQAMALSGVLGSRGVGALLTGGSGGGSRDSGTVNTGDTISVSATVIVQGVTDAASFKKSNTEVAAGLARATNRALQRNG